MIAADLACSYILCTLNPLVKCDYDNIIIYITILYVQCIHW